MFKQLSNRVSAKTIEETYTDLDVEHVKDANGKVYTELNVADGNPDPVTNPAVVYDSENDTLSLTLKYAAFMVTVELTR